MANEKASLHRKAFFFDSLIESLLERLIGNNFTSHDSQDDLWTPSELLVCSRIYTAPGPSPVVKIHEGIFALKHWVTWTVTV